MLPTAVWTLIYVPLSIVSSINNVWWPLTLQNHTAEGGHRVDVGIRLPYKSNQVFETNLYNKRSLVKKDLKT